MDGREAEAAEPSCEDALLGYALGDNYPYSHEVNEQLLKLKPDAKSALLDDLLAKRDRGELVHYVGGLANEKCKVKRFNQICSRRGKKPSVGSAGVVRGVKNKSVRDSS